MLIKVNNQNAMERMTYSLSAEGLEQVRGRKGGMFALGEWVILQKCPETHDCLSDNPDETKINNERIESCSDGL